MYVTEDVNKGSDWDPGSDSNDNLYFDQSKDFYLLVSNVTLSEAKSISITLDYFPSTSYTSEPLIRLYDS